MTSILALREYRLRWAWVRTCLRRHHGQIVRAESAEAVPFAGYEAVHYVISMHVLRFVLLRLALGSISANAIVCQLRIRPAVPMAV